MEVYRLLTGSVSRLNDNGEMESHKAPYEFEPTDGELAANGWRMVRAVDYTGQPISNIGNGGFIETKKNIGQAKDIKFSANPITITQKMPGSGIRNADPGNMQQLIVRGR